MCRDDLISQVKLLYQQIEEMLQAKAVKLERDQKNQSDLYHWCREQMLLIHQMKYQFSQDILQIHRESAKICQQSRAEIEKLRANEFQDALMHSAQA